MSGVTVATMQEVDVLAVDAGLCERLPRRREREIRERLLVRRDPALANAGALA